MVGASAGHTCLEVAVAVGIEQLEVLEGRCELCGGASGHDCIAPACLALLARRRTVALNQQRGYVAACVLVRLQHGAVQQRGAVRTQQPGGTSASSTAALARSSLLVSTKLRALNCVISSRATSTLSAGWPEGSPVLSTVGWARRARQSAAL
jgi:hypothetical protein